MKCIICNKITENVEWRGSVRAAFCNEHTRNIEQNPKYRKNLFMECVIPGEN